MKVKRTVILIITGVSLLLATLPRCGSADRQEVKHINVLIVHSYHSEYLWTQAIQDGIMDVFRDKAFTIKTYFMDTKRHTEEAFKIKAGQKVLALIREFKPLVVITADDNAQEYAGKFLVNKEGISVVFCGVNADPAQYHYPGNNVTGICERPFIRNCLNLLDKVVPAPHSFTVITDTCSTSKGFIAYLKSLQLPVRIDKIIVTDNFKQWQKEVNAIGSDGIITYMYHTIRDRGKPVEPRLVMEWTTQHMNKPSIGFFDFAIEDGVLLGHVESGFEHGELAAKLTLEIIKGKKAAELPIITAQKGMIMVNEKTATILGIDITPIKNIADKIIQ